MINESLVMENIKNSRAFKEQCNQEIINAGHLEELVKHVDGTTAILTRGRQQKPLLKRQRDCVEEEFKELLNFVTLKVKEMFNARVSVSIRLSQDALAKYSVAVSDRGEEGETGTVSDQDAGELGIAINGSPVTLIQIKEMLEAKSVCTHRIWQRGDFKDLKPLLAQHEDHSANIYKVVEFSLTILTVFMKSRQTSKAFGAGSLIETLPKVESWMVAMGWKEHAVRPWETVFAQQILDDANGHLEDTYGNIQSAIGSVLEGRSFSDEEVKEMIAPVPDTYFKHVFHVRLGRGLLENKQGRRFLLPC